MPTAFDVRDYAGHAEVSTTDLYVRRGRKATSNVKPFGALPSSLLGQKQIVTVETIGEASGSLVQRAYAGKLSVPNEI